MVVLDFLAGVPVTVTQSPTATELTAKVTVWEKAVVEVQFTVVCPDVFWTSMALAAMDATLPLALPPGALGADAAPAAEADPTTARVVSRAAPTEAPRRRGSRT
jgi:hypothetical protein